MEINNVFSPVPFYANKRYWHSNKWYTYGQKCPIIMTADKTLPFQLVVSPGVTLSSFTIKKADDDASVMTVNTASNYFNIDAETYSIIQVKACAIGALPYGNYYYALTLSDGSTYISDIIAIISDMSKCIKITYKNVENLYFSSGHIDFTNDFVFELYLPTTIGKPEYEYEEELTKRLGYKFVESQVVNKVYKFTFPATEQLCDAYRFVRMCDYIRIDTYNPDFSDYDHYNVIYLSSEVEWLDNGDIASVETSFETDSIVQKLQDYSRTQLVNFYNALLSNSDEALKFDDETIAQYYSNYIQSIDGKMIRQLNAVSSISDNTVIAIDENNGTGAANKILLKPLLINTVAEQLQASEVLANFQQHINNSAIHITAAERAVLSLFGVDDNGDVYVKGDKGFYTNSFVSAKGKSSSTGGGSDASALYQLVDVLANENNDGVQGATTNSVLMYNGTKWYAGTISTGLDEAALKSYLDANKYTTTAYVDSQVSTINNQITTINSQISAINSQLDTKVDKTDLDKKVDSAFFARVFGLLDANGTEIAINDVATVADSIKAKFGLWTEQYISAKGKSSSTGGSTGSASALYQLVDVLANENNDGVQGATTNSVLMYNGTKWYAGIINTGLDETALKSYLDTNKYTTTSYVDNQIASISSQLDTKADKTALDAYLPLSGGTITGDLTVNGAIYVGTTNYVYHTGNLAGDNTWVTLASDVISHKTIHANNIALIASSGQFVTGYTVDKAGHIVSISQRALNASDIPNIAITQVTGLQDALDKKVDNTFFARVFGLLDADGNEIAVNDVTTVADSIKAKFGLWTEQYISAKGTSSSAGGGGASALYQLADVVPNSTNDGVLNAANGSVLMYNGSKWQAGNVVTDISSLTLNVNGSSLFTYDGKSSITANLTVPTKVSQLTNDSGYLTAITKAQVEGVLTGNITSHTHSYLPLSGGTMTGNINIGNFDIIGYDGARILQNLDSNLGINPSNNVGIGTTSPSYKLHVAGDIYTTTGFKKNGSSDSYVLLGGGGHKLISDFATSSHTHDYLPLSGGTLTSSSSNILTINSTSTNVYSAYEYNGTTKSKIGYYYPGQYSYWSNETDSYHEMRIYDNGGLTYGSANYNYTILHSGNYNSYAPTLTGTGASGTWGIGITGNASTATKLQTPRTIWGQSFDGTNNVSGDLDATGGIIKANYYQITNIGTGPYNVGTIFTGANGDTTYGLNLEAACDSTGATRLPIFIGWRGGKQIMRIMDDLGVAIYHRAHIGQNTNGTAVIDAFDGVARFGCDDYGNGSAKAYVAIKGLTGNVGIGTTSPVYKLDVNGQIRSVFASDNGNPCIMVNPTNNTDWCYGISVLATNLTAGNRTGAYWAGKANSANNAICMSYYHAGDGSDDNKLIWHTWGKGDRMTLTASGNVGIGTTSPNLKLHVYSEVGNVLRVQSSQSYTCIVYQNNGSYHWTVGSRNDNTFFFWNSYKDNVVAQVDINGNFSSIGAVTAKASSSDIRLKTDISDYKALSIIRSHKSIKYHWNAVAKANADVFNDDYWHYGLIAQDVQRDMPQMVSDVFKDYLVINYERLIPICWKGLQEVDDEVTKLKKKVRKLEMEIRELKQKEDRL